MSSSPEGQRVVVVGAGECGGRVVHELVQGGWPGSITLIGRENRPVYERPPLSKTALLADEAAAVEPYAALGGLAGPQVREVLGRSVEALDLAGRSVVLDDGERVGFDALVLATGGTPRMLPGLPPGVLTLRTFEDAVALRSVLDAGGHLLVIGGGLIGLEVAASARLRGLEVTVVEAGPRVLGRAVPDAVAEVIAERHLAEGVRLLTGVVVDSLEPSDAGWSARLSNGEQLSAAGVLVAVGAAPVVELAAAAGVAVGDGILVDEQMRTSAPGVWAAGDCANGPLAVLGGERQRLESWRMAHDQAVTVARSVLGQDPVHDAVPWFWSDQYDLTLHVSGLASLATQWVRRPVGDTFVLAGFDDAGRLVCAAGVGAGGPVAREIKLLERLIGAGSAPDPAALADPSTKLRALL